MANILKDLTPRHLDLLNHLNEDPYAWCQFGEDVTHEWLRPLYNYNLVLTTPNTPLKGRLTPLGMKWLEDPTMPMKTNLTYDSDYPKDTRRFTWEEKQTAIRLRSEGVHIDEIADIIGADRSTLYNWIKYVPENRKFITKQERDEILALYRKGHTYNEIMVITKVSSDTISKIVSGKR